MNVDSFSSDNPGSGSPDESTEVSPTFWSQHKWKAASISGLLLAAVTAVLVLYWHVPGYQASGWITIEETAPYLAFSIPEGSRSAGRYVETQIELLQSPVILGPVMSRPKIAVMGEFQGEVHPLKYLQEHLTINPLRESEVYQVNYVSRSPQRAATVVNAVLEEYLAFQSDECFRQAQRMIDFLEDERARRSLEVERLRSWVMELSKDISGTDPFGHDVVLDMDKVHHSIASLRERLIDVEIEWEVLNEMIQSQKKGADPLPEHAMTPRLSDQDIDSRPEIRGWQAVIDGIGSVLEGMKNLESNGRDNSDMADLVNALQSQQTALGELKQELRELLQQQNNKQVPSHQRSMASMERELVKLDTRKEYLIKQLTEQQEAMKNGGTKCVEFEFAQAELVRQEKVFELIAARKLALQTELRAPSRVRLIKKATAPSAPQIPVPYKVLSIGCLTAFAVPLALAFVFHPSKKGDLTDSRQPFRLLQFSLATLLLWTTLVALLVGLWTMSRR